LKVNICTTVVLKGAAKWSTTEP